MPYSVLRVFEVLQGFGPCSCSRHGGAWRLDGPRLRIVADTFAELVAALEAL